MSNGNNNNNNKYADPTSEETIHGKKVVVGKGTGEQVAKRAKSAMQLRKELQKQYLAEL